MTGTDRRPEFLREVEARRKRCTVDPPPPQKQFRDAAALAFAQEASQRLIHVVGNLRQLAQDVEETSSEIDEFSTAVTQLTNNINAIWRILWIGLDDFRGRRYGRGM